jgi:hypothetical protein
MSFSSSWSSLTLDMTGNNKMELKISALTLCAEDKFVDAKIGVRRDLQDEFGSKWRAGPSKQRSQYLEVAV